jgi:imidazolonepropionase-like amidohydrolase
MNKRTRIQADCLFDTATGAFQRDPVVTVEGDCIASVQFGKPLPAGDGETIELQGCTLLPGLIDAHDHLSLSPQFKDAAQLMSDPDPVLTVRAIVNMQTDLAAGITTSRCLGEKNFVDIHLKHALAQGLIAGPRLFIAARGIKASHGHGVVGTAFAGCDEIREAVRENLKRGADFTKIFVTDTARTSPFLPSYLGPEEIRTAVEESHRAGKMVAAHSIGGAGLADCIGQGVDVIEHAYFASDEQIEDLLRGNRWVVLTPSVFFDDARLANLGGEAADQRRNNREEVAEVYRKILQSGTKFAIGTDASHGRLVEDVIFLVTVLGACLNQCLRAITSSAAGLCGMEHLIGSIRPGTKADLVAVKGNVEREVRNLRQVCFVMKDGAVQKSNAPSPRCQNGQAYDLK